MDILICDDHPVFAEALAELLVARGAGAVAVTDHPAAAVRVLRGAGARVCVLDVMFGAQQVFTYLPTMRAASPTTRFILLTGRLDKDVVSAGRRAGVEGYCQKHQSGAAIMAAIERVADGGTVSAGTVPRAPIPPEGRATSARHAHHLASYLTARERAVLSHLASGRDTRDIATAFGITQATVRSHIQHMLTKLNVHSRLEAVTSVVRSGLVDPQTGQWLAPP